MKRSNIPGSIITMAILTCLFFISGCTSITMYDQHAYERATSLKVESLNLMEKATEPYNDYQQQAEQLQLELKKAHEYAKGLSFNEETTAQWKIISNPQRHSAAGFLERWKEKNILNSDFILFTKKQVAAAFDEVIELEGRKHKQSHKQ